MRHLIDKKQTYSPSVPADNSQPTSIKKPYNVRFQDASPQKTDRAREPTPQIPHSPITTTTSHSDVPLHYTYLYTGGRAFEGNPRATSSVVRQTLFTHSLYFY